MQPPDPDEHLSYLIAKVSHQLGIAIDRALTSHGITLTQFSALAHIARSPGLSSAALARALLTTPQATTTLVGRLISAGLAQRTELGAGLAVSIHLTPHGLRTLYRAEKTATNAEKLAVGALSNTELRCLTKSLGHLSDTIEIRQSVRR
jgi:DNA-binding MarR family transcriptional regulator